MATNSVSGSSLRVVGLLCLALFAQGSCAWEFTVGGSKGWNVPSDDRDSYKQWAEKNRFKIGDSIVFVYPSGQDSVLLVSQEDYTDCKTGNPEKKFDDGHTVFTFEKSGAHHFISGNEDSCRKNEKVAVVVLADRTKPNVAASAPSPTPAKSGEEAPSPPETEDTTPAAAPASETPPPSHKKNDASSGAYASLFGLIGAFAASSIVLVY